jgi:hypothetical protein
VLSLVHSNLVYGSSDGKSELAEDLKLGVERDGRTTLGEHESWTALSDALSLGGSFVERRGRREFCAPYVFSRWPPDIPDDLVGEELPWAIIRRHVAVYGRPSPTAKIVGRLSYDLVQVLSPVLPYSGYRPEWIQIRTPDHKTGYVAGRDIRSHEDAHVCFANFGTAWLVTEFVLGTRN